MASKLVEYDVSDDDEAAEPLPTRAIIPNLTAAPSVLPKVRTGRRWKMLLERSLTQCSSATMAST